MTKQGEEKRCAHCRRTKIPMFIYARGRKRNYYMCRLCARKKMRLYYKTKEGKKKVQEAIKRANNSYPERQRARMILNNEIREGRIRRPKICSKCKKHRLIIGHHLDFSKPLKVKWICRSCQADYIRKRKLSTL